MPDYGYRLVYDSITYNPLLTGISVSFTEFTGFEPEKAIDGDRQTLWKIPDATSTDFWIKWTFSSAVTCGGADGIGIGFSNASMYNKGITSIVYQTSPDDTVWTTIFTMSPVPDMADLLYAGSGSTNAKYHRLVFFTTGSAGPTADVTIGEIILGSFLAFDQNPEPNLRTSLRIPSTRLETEAGGLITSTRGAVRYEEWGLELAGLGQTQRNEIRAVISAQRGQTRPFMLYTQRHTATAAQWTTGGVGSNGTATFYGRAGAYFMNFSDEEFNENEIFQGSFDLSIPMRRTLSSTET